MVYLPEPGEYCTMTQNHFAHNINIFFSFFLSPYILAVCARGHTADRYEWLRRFCYNRKRNADKVGNERDNDSICPVKFVLLIVAVFVFLLSYNRSLLLLFFFC